MSPYFLCTVNSVDQQYRVLQTIPFRVLVSCTTYKQIGLPNAWQNKHYILLHMFQNILYT